LNILDPKVLIYTCEHGKTDVGVLRRTYVAVMSPSPDAAIPMIIKTMIASTMHGLHHLYREVANISSHAYDVHFLGQALLRLLICRLRYRAVGTTFTPCRLELSLLEPFVGERTIFRASLPLLRRTAAKALVGRRAEVTKPLQVRPPTPRLHEMKSMGTIPSRPNRSDSHKKLRCR
jgi:hypothetical protein